MPSSFSLASLTLGSHFEAFITQKVNTGLYASASEVVRDSLRLLEEQDALHGVRIDSLRAEIELGANSGQGIPADQAFANARQRIADIAAGAMDS
jgi:antitoxin ParD1/3/4